MDDVRKIRARLHGYRIKYPDVVECRISDRELLRLATSPCAHCGAAEDICIDHVVPLAWGGRTSIGNLQSLCRSCNLRKGGKFMAEFRLGRRVSAEKWTKAAAYRRALGKL